MHTYAYEVRRGCGIPRTGVADGCEPPYVYWEQDMSPLQEQQALPTELALQPFKRIYL